MIGTEIITNPVGDNHKALMLSPSGPFSGAEGGALVIQLSEGADKMMDASMTLTFLSLGAENGEFAFFLLAKHRFVGKGGGGPLQNGSFCKQRGGGLLTNSV